jgi:hypothetical protein
MVILNLTTILASERSCPLSEKRLHVHSSRTDRGMRNLPIEKKLTPRYP